MDDQETEQQEEEKVEEEKVEAIPDPWKERALAAETGQQQAMAALQQLIWQIQQEKAGKPLADTEPDYSDAEEVGLQPDQLRKIVAKTAAKLAPKIEQASTPRPESWDDRLERMAEAAGEGIDKFDAAREFDRVRRTIGVQVSEREVERQAVKALKERVKEKIDPAKEAQRTSVTSGGSRPPGSKNTVTAPKAKTLVDVIREDQRKRGLYAY
jgi:hypothetical protein